MSLPKPSYQLVASNRRRWLKAMLSGDYKQGRSVLFHKQRYCCLGVALDVLDPDGWKLRPGSLCGAYKHHLSLNRKSTGVLGKRACALLGISETFMLDLAKANDDGKRFPQIAQMIEDYIKGSKST